MTVALLEFSIEKLREEELEEARAIQGVMLPAEPLRVGAVRISHQFQPVAAVGGDFLDYFELADGSIGLYLGDVSGKGLPAAMYAALAVGTLRGVHKTGQSPGTVLSTLNRRLLLQGVPRRYSAAQYAVFDPRTAQMQVTSAGMLGPLQLCTDGCRVLEIPGLPPGLFATRNTILRRWLCNRVTPSCFARMGSRMPSIPKTRRSAFRGCRAFARTACGFRPGNY